MQTFLNTLVLLLLALLVILAIRQKSHYDKKNSETKMALEQVVEDLRSADKKNSETELALEQVEKDLRIATMLLPISQLDISELRDQFSELVSRFTDYKLQLEVEASGKTMLTAGTLDPDCANMVLVERYDSGVVITRISGPSVLKYWANAGSEENIKALFSQYSSIKVLAKAIERRAKDYYFATTDGLTKLSNRTGFFSRLEEETARAIRYRHPLALIMLDLDMFKPVNDRFGHRAGDELLYQVAMMLESHNRESDFVGRLGGDEYIILLPETSRQGAAKHAEDIRAEIESMDFEVTGNDNKMHRVKITVSIGVAIYPDHAWGADDLYVVADEMLQRAKKTRNRVGVARKRYEELAG